MFTPVALPAPLDPSALAASGRTVAGRPRFEYQLLTSWFQQGRGYSSGRKGVLEGLRVGGGKTEGK